MSRLAVTTDFAQESQEKPFYIESSKVLIENVLKMLTE
jgi:hypothetical protein